MVCPDLIRHSYLTQEKLGAPIEFSHVEAYPNWGMTGPFLWIYQRILWDGPSQVDVDALTKQFCEDMFAEGAEPMVKYWTTLEKLWISLNGIPGEQEPVVERKMRKWQTQFKSTVEQRKVVAECRAYLDQAMAAAKERIRFFSDTFRLVEMLLEADAAKTLSAEKAEAIERHGADLLASDPHALYPARPAQTLERLKEAAARIRREKK